MRCKSLTGVVTVLALGVAGVVSGEFAAAASATVDGSAVIAIGNAPDKGSLQSLGIKTVKPVLGLAGDANGNGYWMVASDGGLFAFGDAPFYGSMGSTKLAKPMVGMAPTPDGGGYWLFAGDGGLFAFGDAGFYGSLGGVTLNGPIVAMTPTATGRGYWMLGSDGGVFAFGDAQYRGSTGGVSPSGVVVDMTTLPSGNGYWIVTSTGQIVAFGDAARFGDLTDKTITKPVVGMAATSTGKGYWIAQSDGQVWAFGDASGALATSARCLTQPVVGVAARRPQLDGLWLATAPRSSPATAGLPPLDALDVVNADIEQHVADAQGCQTAAKASSVVFSPPLPGSHVTSGYGHRIHPIYHLPQFHRGIDFVGGTSIRAAVDGTVIDVSIKVGYGLTTILDHGGRISTLYGHQASTSVKVGDKVKAGEVIGVVGMSGFATGPHLHFEIRLNGVVTDPTSYVT